MPTLEFKGKHHIYAHHLSVPYRQLKRDKSRSCNPSGNEDNLIIQGDNLHALKTLLPRYANRVKCIFIDPPYNTGNEGWLYNDNVNSRSMQEWLKKNSPIDNEDMERHDKWLCMMWPRLHLLKELLADDGAIFISIDDNELYHLRLLMDEIFGEENFLANIAWEKRYSRNNDAKLFYSKKDAILVFRKSDALTMLREMRTDEANSLYKNPDNDPRGAWMSVPYARKSSKMHENLVYPIINPNTGETVIHPDYAWKFPKERYEDDVKENRLWWGKNGRAKYPRLKRFLSEVSDGMVPIDMWFHEESGTSDEGTRELKQIFNTEDTVFDYPKPTRLIQRIINLVTKPDGNDIILDSFAGSGTTAHAVLALNKEDVGNRKFILIECEDYADTITGERVRRVINGVENAKDKTLRDGLGGSFAYCTLGEPTEVEGMLTGESLPSYSALATHLLFTAVGVSAGDTTRDPKNEDGLFYSDEKNDYYLLYQPDLVFLSSDDAMLKQEHAERIRDASSKNGKRAIVYAAGNYIGQRELTKMGIAFSQLPYALHER